ncbi:MAG: AAA family ATPase, partial [Anaerolineae bacterium]|nr:AAA family ATPase [Anaerolineae bacterium]
MNEQQAAYFDMLSKARSEQARSLDSFALRGVKNSVVEKYSDQAHFIYELLQNADDAKATTARFELHEGKLIFAHNGTRRFNVSDPDREEHDHANGALGDINAITAIGGSNKTNEATIGKFGVGFKAVFQYTATPHIYDPDIFFKIERFIVPTRLEKDYIGRKRDETLFVFPFDHDDRSAEHAYTDISEKLRSLDYPLLFLSNLKDISFEISGTLGLYGKTTQEIYHIDYTTAEFIRLTQNNGENSDDLYDYWLWLFYRYTNEGYKYAVGFFVGDNGRLIAKLHTAFCFFPTREATGLNFILHAPFLLTDSREGIKAGDQHNTDLISRLSELAADSLVYLRDIGQITEIPLIDDNIFDIIPYDENRFTDINSKNRISFKPFYTAIKEAFNTKAIIPSFDGYVTYKKDAYWAFVQQIAELFSNEQLSFIRNHEEAKWVFTSFGRQDTLRKNKALTTYIDSITKEWLDEDRILNAITAQFIESQPIEWLHRFYKWVSETTSRTELIKTKPIFLDQNRNATAAYDRNKQPILFLPAEDVNGYITIHSDLLLNEETSAFIQKLGITEPSLRDEIYNIILPQYRDDGELDPIPHFKKFFRYYRECSQTEAKSFINLIKECAFIIFQTNSDETPYREKANELYFPSEDLENWFQSKPDTPFVCFDDYLRLVGEDHRDELINFFTDLGVNKMPKIIEQDLSWEEAHLIQESWDHATKGQSWTDRLIDGSKELIETLIKEQDLELSKWVWSQLLQFVRHGYFKQRYSWSQDSLLYGEYQYFYYTSHSKPFESSEAKRLRTQPWLVNNVGKFVSANELTVQTLHPEYEIESDEAKKLLEILQIKAEIQANENKEADLASFAEKLGLSDQEHRQALIEFTKRKQASDKDDEDRDSTEAATDDKIKSVKRVAEEIKKRVTSASKKRNGDQLTNPEDTTADEDDYFKPTVDINQKIEKVKEQAEREIEEIARLEDLKQQAKESKKYSYGWFKTLLELESLSNDEHNANSREISISFAKVEREEGTARTLILKHPNRYIPHFMEDLADIPLELHFADQPMVKVAIEVVSVKSYTLRVKLRTNAQIEGINLLLVNEARIKAKNPVFLIEELRKAFIQLGDEHGYSDEFNMQENLCENIEFIFGPPGTGKTTYLARDIIVPMMRETADLKVLVLTPTNKAADVLVHRLMEEPYYLNWLVRFGATSDNTIEQSGVFRDKTFDIRTFSRNVTVTTIARFSYDYFLPDSNTRLHLNALKWDYIIFDE